MPLERIDDGESWESEVCLNREHNPPQHISLPPGVYKHICPGCGEATIFTINKPIW